MSKPLATLRVLVLGIAVCAAGRAGAVDITGTWAVCMHQTNDPFCPPTLEATLIGTGTTFTMSFPSLNCPDVTGTVDGGTGAMTGTNGSSNCLGGNGALDGTATDTSMSGNIYLNDAICAFQFDAVRACSGCDDGNECTTDGCGATACSAPSSTCTYSDAPPGSSCSDGEVCNGDELCFSGFCSSGGNPAAGTPCSDNNACTVSDQCDGSGTCVPGSAANCDDANVCTGDSCNPATGCVHTCNTGATCGTICGNTLHCTAGGGGSCTCQ